jgi:hypothetical protein
MQFKFDSDCTKRGATTLAKIKCRYAPADCGQKPPDLYDDRESGPPELHEWRKTSHYLLAIPHTFSTTAGLVVHGRFSIPRSFSHMRLVTSAAINILARNPLEPCVYRNADVAP